METIGDRIKSKRKEAGMTQLELASKLNVTDRAVSKWEQNEGNPDISILPRIADLFNVTLDYLMTGIEPKKEVIIMSKIELCAKNDDPSMIKSLPSNVDENGKSILDYVKQYNSKNVLKALIDNCSHQTHYMYLFNAHRRTVKDAIEIMLTCIPVDRERKVIKEIYDKEIRNADEDFIRALNMNDDYSKKIVDGFKKIFRLLVKQYNSLSEEQKDYYFGMKENEGEGQTTCWFNAYPFFVEYSIIEKKQKLLSILLEQIEKHNAWVDSSIEKIRKEHCTQTDFIYYRQHFHGKKVYCLQSTLDYLLSKKDFKLAYRINSFLEKPYVRRKIELLEVENNATITEKDKTEFRCVDCHMIVPEEIEKLKDLKYVKSILENNYANYYEMVYKLLKSDKKELYKFFIDNNLLDLADFLMNGNEKKLLHESWEYFNSRCSDELTIKQPVIITRDSYLPTTDKKYVYYQDLRNVCSDIDNESKKIDKNKLIEYFESFKNNVFEKTKAIVTAEEKDKQDKIERAKLVKGLTREYFDDLLSNDDEEIFVIKLCSLFDAILRFDYKCDAEDFYGRMNQFFDKGPKSQYYDNDDSGYMVLNTDYENEYVQPWNDNRELMNKLRIKRNTIVHPENDERANLNNEELKQCLDFVFAANGGNIING